ncbi:FkbM family methyltransferase [Frigoriglobus tundricola]|uniref:Methyltransferase FkbM domain-containing protein n=1 Tax=Frigoriglobus tundricola TaxID=2774151 RepID=A0A6M5Z1J4_9BACT|nr:FkbM family methyltransferase [Frigoriglobus tundricola]QJW99684.1 hypothetical protein FTUN_7305 [Frigoriglobus tundricola]
MNPFLSWLVRPYVRAELPGWGKLYSRFVGDYRNDPSWAGHPMLTIRGKLHGYEMVLDPSRWSERATYFLGRFYDLESQLLLMRVLRPGDRFVDIGANIGMLSLLAARLTGPAGVVDAFEPNPRCAERIRASVRTNSIGNLRLHPVALADVESTLVLSVPAYNSGEGTLTPIEIAPGAGASGEPAVERFDVPVRIGDRALESDARAPALIKIDVEGYECQVLTGLNETLRRTGPLVLAEVVPGHLARAHRTPEELFDLMAGCGYQPFSMQLSRRGVGKHALALRPATPQSHSGNVLWVPTTSPNRDRVSALLA